MATVLSGTAVAGYPAPVVVNSSSGAPAAAGASTHNYGASETLADAIAFENNPSNAAGYINEISFSSKVTGIDLATTLDITEPIDIAGKGRVTISGGATHSLFTVDAISAGTTDFNGLKLTDGVATGNGGAISATSPIGIGNSTLTDDSAGGYGGAVYVDGAPVAISGSTFSADRSAGSGGSAVFVHGGTLELLSSTVNDNTTGAYGAVTVSDPTSAYTTNIVDSTITGNSSGGSGAGISIVGEGDLGLVDSTVVENKLTGSGTEGAGVFFDSSGTASVDGSIVAENTAHESPDFATPGGGTAAAEFSLIGDDSGSGISQDTSRNDILGTSSAPVNPKLGALGNHGGPTETMVPESGSPVIDKGDSFDQTMDQRNLPRTVDFSSIPNASGGDGTDIGSVERQAPKTAHRKDYGNHQMTLWVPSSKTSTVSRDELPVSFKTVALKHSRKTKLTFKEVQFRVDHGVNTDEKKASDTVYLNLFGRDPGTHTVYARVTYTERVDGRKKTVISTVSAKFRIRSGT